MSQTLTHYGVPGMKWGVRKAKVTGNARSRKSTKRKSRSVKNMSNATLAKKNKRLQLEANYRRLTKESQPWYAQAGSKWVSTAGNAVLVGTATYAANQGVKWIKKKVGGA